MAASPGVPDVLSPPLVSAAGASPLAADARLKDIDPEALAALEFYKQKDTSKGDLHCSIRYCSSS